MLALCIERAPPAAAMSKSKSTIKSTRKGKGRGGRTCQNSQFPISKCQVPNAPQSEIENRQLEMGTRLLKEATTLNQDLTLKIGAVSECPLM